MSLRNTLTGWIPVVLAVGCAQTARVDLGAMTGGNAALIGQFQAYDGHSGRPVTFAEIVRRAGQADVVFFGEEHSDAVCNQIEAQLLYALAGQRRPAALALEFFENDTQAALEAYLVGRLDEAAFREQTRQGRAYVLSHRPLVELCRMTHLPVVAANSPRRLVTAFRKSGLSYEEYRAGLEPSEQRWLPTTNEYVGGAYEVRFLDLMAQHEAATPTTQPATQPAPAEIAPTAQPRETSPATTTQPSTTPAEEAAPTSAPASAPATPAVSSQRSFYWSQLLWDQALAESLVHFRQRYPSHRVMLVVGSFHVAHTGGTVTKFVRRRPHDRLLTIVYRSTVDGRFPFREEDKHAGDIVIYGIVPPPKKEADTQRPSMPATTQPTTATASATQPAAEPPRTADR